MRGYYKDLQASLFYFTKLFIAENAAIAPGLFGYKFDAHAQNTALPKVDLIGPQGFSIVDNTGLVTVTAQFLICTLDDENLFRLDDLTDALYDKLKPDRTLPIVDHTSGVQIGNFKATDGTTVFPVERAENRPIKSIAVEFKVDRSPTLFVPAEAIGIEHWDQMTTWDASTLWQ